MLFRSARLVPTSVAVPMVGASGTSGTAVMPGINVLLETLLMIVIKDVLNQEISEPNTVNERLAVEAYTRTVSPVARVAPIVRTVESEAATVAP